MGIKYKNLYRLLGIKTFNTPQYNCCGKKNLKIFVFSFDSICIFETLHLIDFKITMCTFFVVWFNPFRIIFCELYEFRQVIH